MSSSQPKLIPHLPALDGLRGLALLGVLAFHSRKLLTGGYLGVDLFFVLSGYLITSLLVAEHQARGTIALGQFWVRRARRLLPALLSLMPAIAIYSVVFAEPSEFGRIRADAVATLAYVANWNSIASTRSYWDLFAAPSPLEHTWSLAIEEQFYVLWPLIVAFALRRGSPRTVLKISIAGAALSVGAMLVLYSPERMSRVYFGTDTRATAIFAGAIFGIVFPPSTQLSPRATRIVDVLGIVAVGGLATAWVSLPGESSLLYRGGLWLTELGGLALIAAAVAGPEKSLVARALAFRPLVLVGLISYGLYLWHWPIDVFVTPQRFHVSATVARILQVVLTFAIAIASYHVLEKPIRFGRLRVTRPALLAFALLAFSFVVAFTTRARALASSSFTNVWPVEATLAEPRFSVAMFGDSTANSLGWTLRGTGKPGLVVELQGKDGCVMIEDTCGGVDWKSDVERIKPDVALVFGGGAFLYTWASAGGAVKACHPDWIAEYTRILRVRLGEIAKTGTRTLVATLPHSRRQWDGEQENREIDCVNGVIETVANELEGVSVLNLAERVCPSGECPEREPNQARAIRPDGIHFDVEGSRPIGRWVLERIVGATAANDL